MTTDAQAAILAAALGATSPAMESDQSQPQPVVETLDVVDVKEAGLKAITQKQPPADITLQGNQPQREQEGLDVEALKAEAMRLGQAALDRAGDQAEFYEEYTRDARRGFERGFGSTWRAMEAATEAANNPGVARPVGAPIDKTPRDDEEHDHER